MPVGFPVNRTGRLRIQSRGADCRNDAELWLQALLVGGGTAIIVQVPAAVKRTNSYRRMKS